MNTPTLSSPISLSYIASLRSFQPRSHGEAFTYADADCQNPDLLTCLAASNPEGKFYGLIADAAASKKAQDQADLRGVKNVTFLNGRIADFLKSEKLPPLNYLSYNESSALTDKEKRADLFDLAEKLLLPNGLLNITYLPHKDVHGALRFLVREFAPAMTPEQANVFLQELKKIGKSYFESQPSMAAKLDKAIKNKTPDQFFELWNDGEASSATFDVMCQLRPRGFSYAGDTQIAINYIELSIPAEAQQIVLESVENPLFEAIKDLALNRVVRSDIWCRHPVIKTKDMASLFGKFSFGITMPHDQVPTEVKVFGKTVELKSSLYTKLISLMSLTPVSIGDFLSHPDGKNYAALDVLGALQILTACGIASPMRGESHLGSLKNLNTPRLAGSFNQYLNKTEVTNHPMHLASVVTGDVITVSPREALVIQAINRGGFENSVSALLPELTRLAKNPIDAASITGSSSELTPAMAEHMIKDVLNKSMIQWYAYGVLEAA